MWPLLGRERPSKTGMYQKQLQAGRYPMYARPVNAEVRKEITDAKNERLSQDDPYAMRQAAARRKHEDRKMLRDMGLNEQDLTSSSR